MSYVLLLAVEDRPPRNERLLLANLSLGTNWFEGRIDRCDQYWGRVSDVTRSPEGHKPKKATRG